MSSTFYTQVECWVEHKSELPRALSEWLNQNKQAKDYSIWHSWGRWDGDANSVRRVAYRGRDRVLMRRFELYAQLLGVRTRLCSINNSPRLDVEPDPNPEPRIVCVHASGAIQLMIEDWCSHNFPDLSCVRLREITGTLSPLVTIEFYNKYSKQEFVDNWFDVLGVDGIHFSEQRAFEHLVQPCQWGIHTIVDRQDLQPIEGSNL